MTAKKNKAPAKAAKQSKAKAKPKTAKPKNTPAKATPAPEPRPPINIGPQTVTVVFDGRPHTVAKSPMIAAAITAGDWQGLRLLCSPAHAIAAKAAALTTRAIGELRVTDAGTITFKGRPLNNASARRIIELMRDGFPIESELRTLANLMLHDDVRVIEGFESYLDKWRIPRLEDGRIVLVKSVARGDLPGAFKARNDFPWVVGQTARIGWDEIDRDPASTCSRGLHACPLAALHNHHGAGNAIIELHVWPEHIGAFPTDYLSNGKIRVVEAFVSRELPADIREENLTGRA